LGPVIAIYFCGDFYHPLYRIPNHYNTGRLEGTQKVTERPLIKRKDYGFRHPGDFTLKMSPGLGDHLRKQSILTNEAKIV